VFLQVAVGGEHACALPDNGVPVCWGANGSSQSSPLPGPFQQLALGDAHGCGLKIDGTVECWGLNDQGQSNVEADSFTSIVAGYRTTCGIKTDGVAICWGRIAKSYGYLKQIDFALLADPDTRDEYIFCGLKADNTLSCPPITSAPSGVFSYVTTGGHQIDWSTYYLFDGFACGIRESGLVACWGENNYNRTTPPVGVTVKHPPICITDPASCHIGVIGEAAAVIEQDLSLHVSRALYKSLTGDQMLWIELRFFGQNEDGKLLWELTDYGEAK
jgi:hypothetical protein